MTFDFVRPAGRGLSWPSMPAHFMTAGRRTSSHINVSNRQHFRRDRSSRSVNINVDDRGASLKFSGTEQTSNRAMKTIQLFSPLFVVEDTCLADPATTETVRKPLFAVNAVVPQVHR